MAYSHEQERYTFLIQRRDCIPEYDSDSKIRGVFI